MDEKAIDRELDLRGTVCPMNFVKTKLALEEMETGQVLEIVLDSGEPIRNVPRSLKDDGHKILRASRRDDAFVLMIEKG